MNLDEQLNNRNSKTKAHEVCGCWGKLAISFASDLTAHAACIFIADVSTITMYSLAAIATAIIRGSIMYHDHNHHRDHRYRFHFCLIFALVKIDPDQQSTQPCTHVAQAAIPVEILSLLELPSAVGPHFHVLSKGGGGLGHCNDR